MYCYYTRKERRIQKNTGILAVIIIIELECGERGIRRG